MNLHDKVLSEAKEKVITWKYYVYLLVNPIDNKIFYVGKGIGKRAWEHLKAKGCNKEKNDLIKFIYANNQKPKVLIYKDDISELEALGIESDLINTIPNLTNKQTPGFIFDINNYLHTVVVCTPVETKPVSEKELQEYLNRIKKAKKIDFCCYRDEKGYFFVHKTIIEEFPNLVKWK
jgi:hypothetical protein